MKILSLFDGISCARVALERAGIPVEQYYASEIDKYAIQISQKNWPEIVQIGDVKDVTYTTDDWMRELVVLKDNGIQRYPNVRFDLLIGGSPCQDLSIAKANRKGLDGERSGLFWEYVRILKEAQPKFFILENVASMPKDARDTITEALGVEPVMINASLVSAQNRKRLFWVGKWTETETTFFADVPLKIVGYEKVEIPQPEDKGILLKDILLDGETEDLKSLCITATYHKKNERDFIKKGSGQMIKIGAITKGQSGNVYSIEGKSSPLCANGGGNGAKTGLYDVKDTLRKLHPIECERLQGLPDGYTEGVSNTQRYKALGNGFNVDVICHILKYIG